MAHSENMTQKSDYQLNWIIANKPAYSESQIKAALAEINYPEAEPSRYQMVFAMQTDLFPTWKVGELNT